MSSVVHNLPTRAQLIEENNRLHARLEKAEQASRAIPIHTVKPSARPVQNFHRRLARKENEYGNTSSTGMQAREWMEQILRQSEVRYRSLVEVSPDTIFVNRDNRIVFVNKAALELFGATNAGQIIGKSPFDLFSPIYHDLIRERTQKLLAGEAVPVIEVNIVRLDGTLRVVEVAATAFTDTEGPSIQVMLHDITEHKRMERELQGARAKAERHANELDIIFNSITEGIVVYDVEGRAQRTNQTAVEMLGFDPTDVNFVGLAKVLSSRTLDGTPLDPNLAPSGRALRGETVVGEHYILTNLREEDTIVVASASPLWNGDQIAGAVAFWQNVTRQFKAEETQAWLASFPELNPNPVLELDQSGKIYYLNPSARRLFPELEARGSAHPWLNNLQAVVKNFRNGKKQIITREVQIGESYYLQSLHYLQQNRRMRIYGFDITARKRAEEALRQSRDKLEQRVHERTHELAELNLLLQAEVSEHKQAVEALRMANVYTRSLIEASLDPLVTITPEGKIGDVNTATEKVTGLTRQELIGTDFHSYFSNPEKARAGYRKVFDDGSVRDFELEIRHKDGHITPVLYNASVYRDEAGKTLGVFAVAHDISERKQFDAQLMQAEKHATIGRMVGSVTHEINNPLQTIKNCLYLIQQDTSRASTIQEPLEMATSETARLTNLVGQLRELYRPRTDLQKKPQELLNILEEVHALLTPHLNNYKVQWKPLSGLERCYIECVRDQILEVFLNISMNAIEAMHTSGGTLFVDITLTTRQVGVIFRDTGPGILPEIMPRLFEPFMTTKSSGLGLGLSICYGIIHQRGGRIVVENCADRGASFTIWLPVAGKTKQEKAKNGA